MRRDAITSGRDVAEVAPDDVRDDGAVPLVTFERAVEHGSWEALPADELAQDDRATRAAAAHGQQVCRLAEDDVL